MWCGAWICIFVCHVWGRPTTQQFDASQYLEVVGDEQAGDEIPSKGTSLDPIDTTHLEDIHNTQHGLANASGTNVRQRQLRPMLELLVMTRLAGNRSDCLALGWEKHVNNPLHTTPQCTQSCPPCLSISWNQQLVTVNRIVLFCLEAVPFSCFKAFRVSVMPGRKSYQV